MDKDNPTTRQIDLLGLIADDRHVVTYRPRWNTFTGGMAPTVLLQQIVFWWVRSGRRPFYKFARPCAHRLYHAGDSWEEELSMNRRELENARGRIAARTRGEIEPTHLISYWVDAQRITWYALNESVLFQHLAALYPPGEAGHQLTLMDETYIRSNGRNVHQPAAELMDETYITANGRNVQQLMDETSITTDVPNVHPLITENKTNQQRSPQTTTTPSAAQPAAAAAADPLQHILDWINFDDALTPKERAAMTLSDLLAWAYWVKLKQVERGSRVYNPVGLVRHQWRKGQPPRADLQRLARGWLQLNNDGRARLLGRLEWHADYGAPDHENPFEDDYPDIPPAAALAVYIAAAGQLAPPALSPAEAIAPPTAAEPAPRPAASVAALSPAPTWPLWRDALDDLKLQMTNGTFNTHLRGTSATAAGDALTIHVRNDATAEWLQARLHPVIQRTVDQLAGRPITITYLAPQEAHP